MTKYDGDTLVDGFKPSPLIKQPAASSTDLEPQIMQHYRLQGATDWLAYQNPGLRTQPLEPVWLMEHSVSKTA